MPNTPALIKMGITGFFATKNISLKTQSQAIKILSQIGEVVELPNEAMIDTVTAISGSGPGYIFKFVSAIEKAALKAGLPESILRKFIFSTFFGSIQLWNQSGESSNDLILKVASKGGTTQEALNYLEACGFDDLIIKAIGKAKDKSKNLSLEIDHQIQKHSNK
jgi:pyrroline-5-carboxylate reductase